MIKLKNNFKLKAGILCMLACSFFGLVWPINLSSQAASNSFAVDLTVASLEVTQAIQTTTNSIQLIAQRSTAVRTTIGVTGSAAPVSGVTGRLHVFVDGAEITPVAGIAPINAPFSAPLSPQRGNENDTLNFELSSPTGITASANVRFRVDLTPVPMEMDTGNNSGEVTLSFVNRTTPLLYFTRINHVPSGRGLPAISTVQGGVGDAFVRGIVPINDSDSTLYREGLFPTLNFNEDNNGDGVIQAIGAEGNNLLALLSDCRQLIVNGNMGAADRIFLNAWVNGNVDGNGLAVVGGRVSFANTEAIRGQRSYAHELTHNFGFDHNTANISPEVGWDVGARLVNNPMANNTTGRLKPSTFFDIQNAGRLTNEAWINTTNYNLLNSSSTLASSPDVSARLSPFAARVAIVTGIIDLSGERLLALRPVFRYPWLSQPTIQRATDPNSTVEIQPRYVLEILDDQQNLLRRRFAGLVADDGKDEEQFGFFEVMAPVDPAREIVAIRIVDSTNGRELGRLQRGAPPKISILFPQNGGLIGKNSQLIWSATDSDTPQDQLVYQIAYSSDNGQTFVPLAVALKQTSFTFDANDLQRSQGNAVLRIFVSDGLNTAFADVTGLTTAESPCNTICFRSAEYYLRIVNSLPTGSVLVGGVNNNAPVSTNAAGTLKFALKGGTLPLQKLNQQFVAAQLNALQAGGSGSPAVYTAFKSPISCYNLIFAPVKLDNGVTVASGTSLGDLFEQARLAIRDNRQTDMATLAQIFELLNGHNLFGRCNTQ